MTRIESKQAGAFAPAVLGDSLIETIATTPDDSQTPDVPALTTRMARGEEAAFHQFCQFYFHRLLRYLLVVTGGQEETARDALQTAFVRVARHVRRFDSEAAFWNWLAMLARNCVVDELRKRDRYQGLLARFFQQRPVVVELPADEAAARLAELLREELAGLPPPERVLLERKYLHGEPIRVLAAEWSMTEKAMESHLLRLRRKLKTAILGRLQHETND